MAKMKFGPVYYEDHDAKVQTYVKNRIAKNGPAL
jgi:hypothetical protein